MQSLTFSSVVIFFPLSPAAICSKLCLGFRRIAALLTGTGGRGAGVSVVDAGGAGSVVDAAAESVEMESV
jgi:hypothetical protein